ncbi:MAG: glycosyltransferase family 4 protein [Nocardioidaceae bacterium]|nr:glycosyltransferase family 4 protein [Nocardioidaceae bacterium]
MAVAAMNLLWCRPGAVGGSEEYLVRQLLGLVELGLERTRRPVVYCLDSFAETHPDVATEFELVRPPLPGDQRPLRVAAEHTWLAARTRRHSLVHHGGGTAPAVGHRPIVLTVHDLQYRALPQNFTAAKRAYLSQAVPRSVRRAAVITTPSRFVADTVIEAFDADPAALVVVPHGIPSSLGRTASSAGDLRRRFGLGEGRVVVYPSITHPHKNHGFLIELLAKCWTDPELRLVLLGGAGSADAAVRRAIEAADVADRVIRPGRVSEADRDGLVRLADALVFPSTYEGFGAPVAEAMALGTPVITSDEAALPEVVGNAGLVLPLRLDDWAGALDDVGRRRSSLVSAGRARLAHFTLRRSAGALLRAYDLALERSA